MSDKIHPAFHKNKELDHKKLWEDNHVHVIEWINSLNFISIILQFLGEHLKEIESTIGWIIILLTSLISFITLFDLESLGTDSVFNTYYNWGKSVTLSLLSITTTLLAAWSKKKQFVKRIKEIDKQVNELERTVGEFYSITGLPIEYRTNYINFYNENIDKYKELSCFNHLITPRELNYVLYTITKYYPNLTGKSWPWYDMDENPNIKFGHDIIKSYEYTNYTTGFRKFIYCYYCRSKCCYNFDDGNPFTIEQESELDNFRLHKIKKKHANEQIKLETLRKMHSKEKKENRDDIEIEINNEIQYKQ